MITKELLDAYAAAIIANYYAEFPELDGIYIRYSIDFETGKKYSRAVKTRARCAVP